MARREIETRTVESAEAKRRWDELLDGVSSGQTQVIVEADGKAIAAVISANDLLRLRTLEADRERQFAVIDRAREAFRDVPPEEIEREVAKAIAEVRAENRTRAEQATGAA